MLHTNIEANYLKGKPALTVISFSDEKYMYKLTKDNSSYLLKGYKIVFTSLEESDARANYIEVLRQLGLIYQEYYLAKLDCCFSSHFAKPLCIESSFQPPEGPGENATVCAEILFEHTGESLESYRRKAAINLKQIYNWMQQSASALSFLHAAGISHLDIKPNNMMYNEQEDTLKIMDMDSSAAYTSQTQIFSSPKSVTSKIRELTIYYAPPEILQAYNNKALTSSPISDPIEFIVRNIDIYCWAMCFYTLLLKKKDRELEKEMSKHKLCKLEDYKEFIESIKENMTKFSEETEEGKVLKHIIQEILIKCLQYEPKDRPHFDEVINIMRDYDKANNIKLKYTQQKAEAIEKNEVLVGLREFLRTKEEKLELMQTEHSKLQEEYKNMQLEDMRSKERLDELALERHVIAEALTVKKEEFDLLKDELKNVEDIDILRKKIEELRNQLKVAKERAVKLEHELITQKSIAASIEKKSQSYNELQAKYNNDIALLTKENERLSNKIQELTHKP